MKHLLSPILSVLIPMTATAMPAPETGYYAFYSAEAAAKIGTVVYVDADGNDVVATMISRTPNPVGYLWEDTVALGKVETFKSTMLYSEPTPTFFRYR